MNTENYALSHAIDIMRRAHHYGARFCVLGDEQNIITSKLISLFKKHQEDTSRIVLDPTLDLRDEAHDLYFSFKPLKDVLPLHSEAIVLGQGESDSARVTYLDDKDIDEMFEEFEREVYSNRRFNKTTTIGEIVSCEDFAPYGKYMFYGWGEGTYKNYASDCTPAGLDCLNDLYELIQDGKVSIYYLNKQRPDINLIHLAHHRGRPVFIGSAGGGYCSVCTQIESLPAGLDMYKRGYDVFLLTYGVVSQARMPGPIEDLCDGVRYLFNHEKELQIDMDGYVLMGASAAGHLIAEFGTDNHGYAVHGFKKPGMLVLQYPVISMIGNDSHGESKRQAIGDEASLKEQEEYSIHKHVGKDYPKTFLTRAFFDPCVPVETNADYLKQAFADKGIENEYHVYRGRKHSWGNGEGTEFEGWMNDMVDYLHKEAHIAPKASVKDVKENPVIGKYIDSLYFGAYEEWKDRIIALMSFYTYDSLNWLYEQELKGCVHTYYHEKNRPFAHLMHLSHNDHRKVAVIVSGGGLGAIDHCHEGLPMGQYLYGRGYDVFLVVYGVKENAYLDGPAQDLNNAVKYIFDHADSLGIDPRDYFVIGGSAGGYIVGQFGTKEKGYRHYGTPRPACLGLAYPVVDFNVGQGGITRDFALGKTPAQSLVDEYSVVEHVDAEYPPTYLVQSKDDPAVPVENSIHMDEALKHANVCHEMHLYETGGHGWSTGYRTESDGWMNDFLRFYEGILKRN